MIGQLLREAFEAFDHDRLDEAERLYREVLVLLEERDSDEYRNALHMLAFVKSHQKDFVEARQIYISLHLDAVRRSDKAAEAIALHQLGMVERLAEEYDAAISLFGKEFALRNKHLPEDHIGFSANLYEQGYIALLTGNLDTAHAKLLQALGYGESAHDQMCVACAFRGLGEVEVAQRNLVNARRYFLLSVDAFRKAGDKFGVTEVTQLIEKL